MLELERNNFIIGNLGGRLTSPLTHVVRGMEVCGTKADLTIYNNQTLKLLIIHLFGNKIFRLTLCVNSVKQDFVSLYLITLFVSHCWKVKFDEVLNVVTSFPEPPVKRIESAAEINYLTFLTSFLFVMVFPREENCTVDARWMKCKGSWSNKHRDGRCR